MTFVKMAEKTEKQLITNSTPKTFATRPDPSFEVDRFDNAIQKKGYRVYHSKALRCPCVNRDSSSPLPNCQNCSGLGWFFVDKRETRAIMQGMGNSKKYESWSETNAGTVNITNSFDDDVTYMDKFEMIDLEANFSQILNIQKYLDIVFAFTIYEPTQVNFIYKFVDSNSPLEILSSKEDKPNDWDYYIDRNKLVFNPAKIFEGDTVSVRYKHIPVYCVIDITREIFKTRNQACSPGCEEGDLSLRGMPQKSIGRRLHYIWNANKISGPAEFDNTNPAKYEKEQEKYTSPENNIIF